MTTGFVRGDAIAAIIITIINNVTNHTNHSHVYHKTELGGNKLSLSQLIKFIDFLFFRTLIRVET